ncbi:exodeoxyribonuclease VII large subunit [Halovivax gelatinilyticus]|uniref:exodeoxyribonuclease VII large subunit n=1 Tax=Halovivax gelatinilyticus TaxID=2961597 RepID=UPI0020CA38F9|nr:exodeoxyribonuclease VII large subunit [Halovivax gelatinilyticus]
MAGTDEGSTTVETAELASSAWSVSRLNGEIEAVLDRAGDRFPTYVVGEIAEVNRYDFGTFFELRDLEDEAVISCLAWSFAVDGFDRELENGTEAIVRASVDFYPERGDTQLVVSDYWPVGDSDRSRELAELRSALEAEGLLDELQKQSLPEYPDCIGVVTSLSGSAREDFVSAVRSRWAHTSIRLCGATVQGENAVPSLVGAIQTLEWDAYVDVIVVTRGGGSDTDLWCFNEEAVVRSIADCLTPVVVAVGHEDDETLAEAVADRRAMTPTDAGVTTTPNGAALNESIGQLERYIDVTYDGLVDDRLGTLERRIENAFKTVKHEAKTEAVTARAARGRVGDLEARIDRAYDRRVERELETLDTRIDTAYRDLETDARVAAGTAEARRLRIVVAALVALLLIGTALVLLLLL